MESPSLAHISQTPQSPESEIQKIETTIEGMKELLASLKSMEPAATHIQALEDYDRSTQNEINKLVEIAEKRRWQHAVGLLIEELDHLRNNHHHSAISVEQFRRLSQHWLNLLNLVAKSQKDPLKEIQQTRQMMGEILSGKFDQSEFIQEKEPLEDHAKSSALPTAEISPDSDVQAARLSTEKETEKVPATVQELKLEQQATQIENREVSDIFERPETLIEGYPQLKITFDLDPAATFLSEPQLIVKCGVRHLSSILVQIQKAYELLEQNKKTMQSTDIKNPQKTADARKKFFLYCERAANWAQVYSKVFHRSYPPDQEPQPNDLKLVERLELEARLERAFCQERWTQAFNFASKLLSIIPVERARHYEILRMGAIAAFHIANFSAAEDLISRYRQRHHQMDKELETILSQIKKKLPEPAHTRTMTEAASDSDEDSEEDQEEDQWAINYQAIVFLKEFPALESKCPDYAFNDMPQIRDVALFCQKNCLDFFRQFKELYYKNGNQSEKEESLKQAKIYLRSFIEWTKIYLQIYESHQKQCETNYRSQEALLYLLNCVAKLSFSFSNPKLGIEEQEIWLNQGFRFALKSKEIKEKNWSEEVDLTNYFNTLYVLTCNFFRARDFRQVIQNGAKYLDIADQDTGFYEDVREWVLSSASRMNDSQTYERYNRNNHTAKNSTLEAKAAPEKPQAPPKKNARVITSPSKPQTATMAEKINQPPRPKSGLKEIKQGIRIAIETEDDTSFLSLSDDLYELIMPADIAINVGDKREYNFLKNLIARLLAIKDYERAQKLLAIYHSKNPKNHRVQKLLDMLEKKKLR